MSDLRFEWDPRKAAANTRKHGVTFEEAQTAFADEHGLVVDDPEHSLGEARFILLGLRRGTQAPGCRSLLPSQGRCDPTDLGTESHSR